MSLRPSPAASERRARESKGYFRERGWDNVKIARTLRELIGENVINPQHPEAVSRALRWAEAGMAFADALHLALSASATEFASFDDALRKKAATLGISPAVTAP